MTLDDVAAVVMVDRDAHEETVGVPAILRAAVDRLGLRAPDRLARTAEGRPYLVHTDGRRWEVDFSISHSGDLVGVALGVHGRVGLDIQELATGQWKRIARRWLHPDEWNEVAALPEPADRRAFTRFWAIREARCKATGAGLAGFRSPTAISEPGEWDGVWWRELPAPDGYAAALATTVDLPVVELP
jgi:hypothetical protein